MPVNKVIGFSPREKVSQWRMEVLSKGSMSNVRNAMECRTCRIESKIDIKVVRCEGRFRE